MLRRLALSLIALSLAAGLARAQESASFAEPTVRSTHGDWQVLCVLNENLLEECFAGQALDDQTSGQRAMTVMVMKAPDPGATMPGSVQSDTTQAATAASTALPPRSAAATPASAARFVPAATTVRGMDGEP